ncbi:MAG: hypothetical protein VKP63_05305 [Cyanobacteriota bacterium]|nr:hypothetical protein [Cyanobacteriota bacterium]
MSAARPAVRGPLGALGGLALLALVLQQVLLRQPPRLLRLSPAPASSGPAALRLRFSRPMDPASLAASRLDPPLAHRWLGEGDTFLLTLAPGQWPRGPLRLTLAGRDQAGVPLPTRRWLWDPRPRLLAVVPVAGGDQVWLRDHDGRWRPLLATVWRQIVTVEVLGDGAALALVSREEGGRQQVWRLPLRQRNLAPEREGLGTVSAGAPQALEREPILFAHISGNRRGELLVQAGGMGENGVRTQLWPASGSPRALALEATGTASLLPEGGALVVPRTEGLTLETLPPRAPRRQILPGSRDLLAFCPRSGRALLRRHWPDYRRSLEWLEPGQPPREIWRGSEALLAATCQGSGERLWVALMSGDRRPQLSLLALDRQGRQLRRRALSDWELEPGTQLHDDPATDQLVAALRPLPPAGREGTAPPPPARAVVLAAKGRFLPLAGIGPSGGDPASEAPASATPGGGDPGPVVRQVLWLAPGAAASQ